MEGPAIRAFLLSWAKHGQRRCGQGPGMAPRDLEKRLASTWVSGPRLGGWDCSDLPLGACLRAPGATEPTCLGVFTCRDSPFLRRAQVYTAARRTFSLTRGWRERC